MGRNWFDSGYDSLQDGYVGGRKVEVVGHEEGGVNYYAYVDEGTRQTVNSPYGENPTTARQHRQPTATHQQQQPTHASARSARTRSVQNVGKPRPEDPEAKAAKAAQEEYYRHQREYQRAAANAETNSTGYETRPSQMDRKVSDASAKSNSSISSIGKGIAKGVDKLRAKIHAATAPKTPPGVADKTSSAVDVSNPPAHDRPVMDRARMREVQEAWNKKHWDAQRRAIYGRRAGKD